MANLTKEQLKLLEHPPTEGTWLCRATQHAGELIPNVTGAKACWLCRSRKPRHPRLLWPAYVRACEVAGIEPGEKWPPKAAPSEATSRATKRKGPR